MLTEQEMNELYDKFLNEYSLWNKFREFMEDQGLSEDEQNQFEKVGE